MRDNPINSVQGMQFFKSLVAGGPVMTSRRGQLKLLVIFRYLLAIILLAVLSSCHTEQSDVDNKAYRPNILLIVADDLGFSDLGSFGGEIDTPNLDKLAFDGIRMTNFYAAFTCSPTRSMLLSGTDSHLAGLGTMAGAQTPEQLSQPGYEGYLNHRVTSVAELLQDAGYQTYMTGKWHLGLEEEQSPSARGFDKTFALLQGGSNHFNDSSIFPEENYKVTLFRENGKLTKIPQNFYSTTFYTDKMLEFLEQGAKDKPFFAYLAYTAPHFPLQAPEKDIKKYKGRYDAGYEVLLDQRVKKLEKLGLIEEGVVPAGFSPDVVPWSSLSNEEKRIEARKMEIYAAMVDNMDQHIGRVIEYLKDTGQFDNTLIIFMSDNGAEGSPWDTRPSMAGWLQENFDQSYENMGKATSWVTYGPGWAQAGSAPARLYKVFPSEGGIRVPAIVHYPENKKYNKVVRNAFTSVMDIAPTLLEIADTEHPGSIYKGRAVLPYQGESMLPYLAGRSEAVHKEDYVMGWELYGRSALRKGDWKLLRLPAPYGSDDWQLYNIDKDPAEKNDLASKYPEKLAEMLRHWQEYVDSNGVILAN